MPECTAGGAAVSDPLSEQQRRRIAAARERRLAPWRERGAVAGDPETVGVVITHFGAELELEPLAGGEHLRCFLRATVDPVVTGDRVLFEHERDEDGTPVPRRGVVTARLPRDGLLARHTARGLKPVCANLDVLVVVLAPEPAPHADLLDRYLLAAALDELDVLLVLNKAELPAASAPALAALLAPYPALGVPVLRVSADTGAGLDALRTRLAGRAAALVGQSGVGKSSLLNALVPGAGAEVGTLSTRRNRGRGRGRHTTSVTRLYRLDGGVLVDSPGIRAFEPDVPTPEALAAGFPEVADFAVACRFRDCRHENEPGCAVRAAIAAGTVAASRLASWQLLRAEAEDRARP